MQRNGFSQFAHLIPLYDISPSKEYKELLLLISRNEDKLLATMTDTQKKLFTKYADWYMTGFEDIADRAKNILSRLMPYLL